MKLYSNIESWEMEIKFLPEKERNLLYWTKNEPVLLIDGVTDLKRNKSAYHSKNKWNLGCENVWLSRFSYNVFIILQWKQMRIIMRRSRLTKTLISVLHFTVLLVLIEINKLRMLRWYYQDSILKYDIFLIGRRTF